MGESVVAQKKWYYKKCFQVWTIAHVITRYWKYLCSPTLVLEKARYNVYGRPLEIFFMGTSFIDWTLLRISCHWSTFGEVKLCYATRWKWNTTSCCSGCTLELLGVTRSSFILLQLWMECSSHVFTSSTRRDCCKLAFLTHHLCIYTCTCTVYSAST